MKTSLFAVVLFFSTVSFATSNLVPVKISLGDRFSCALFENGKVKCWGHNYWGYLGLEDTEDRGYVPSDMGDNLPYVNLGDNVKVKDIQSGAMSNCILTLDNKVKCWGNPSYGCLGYENDTHYGNTRRSMGDNLPYIDFGSEGKIAELSVGFNHSCVIFEDRRIKCWGNNYYGQLGDGVGITRGGQPNTMGNNLPFIDLGVGEKVKKLSIGYDHTCALLESGKIKCWGNNQQGELGLGDTLSRGGRPNEMGASLPYVNLGTDVLAIDIASSMYSTCAILMDHRVKCWGRSYYGELGLGNTRSWGFLPEHMGDNLETLDLGFGLIPMSIHALKYSYCVRFVGNTMKCWGYNQVYSLGIGDFENRGNKPDQMGNHLPFVYLGARADIHQIFASRGEQVCVSMSQRNTKNGIKCWGPNGYGQLGLGDGYARGNKQAGMGDNLPYLNLGSM